MERVSWGLSSQMSDNFAAPWLVMLLQPSLAVAICANEPGGSFIADGLHYREAYQGDIVATFDRLIDADGHFVGLMIWPVAACTPGFVRSLPSRPYLRVADDGSYLEVYLSNASPDETESGGPQSLLGQIYRTAAGDITIGADLPSLIASDADLDALRAANVRWVEVTR
jgi:hypothetical protein